ncbi:MAG: hypothetical protein U9R42_10225 [Bacteroidota bacterium]|nr:hypothetical protein [Bacteroidota bacterium]
MRKLYISFFLIFAFGFTVIGQNIDMLDKKNGFQNFKFNTPLKNYQKYSPAKVNKEHYQLKTIKDVSIGNYDLESLELYFKNGRLTKVKVTLDDQDRQKNEKIFNALITNYGRYTYHRSSSTFTYTSEMIWKGEFVTLIYAFTSYREGGEFKTKIYLTYSHTGAVVESDLADDL